MVKVMKSMEIEAGKVLEGVTMRMVIGPADGAPHFNMRIFDVQPGFSTPHHAHWWEHEVYILAGRGVVRDAHGEHPIEAGMAVLVPGDVKHQFVNTGEDVLRFMCLVPQEWMESALRKRPPVDDSAGCMG